MSCKGEDSRSAPADETLYIREMSCSLESSFANDSGRGGGETPTRVNSLGVSTMKRVQSGA